MKHANSLALSVARKPSDSQPVRQACLEYAEYAGMSAADGLAARGYSRSTVDAETVRTLARRYCVAVSQPGALLHFRKALLGALTDAQREFSMGLPNQQAQNRIVRRASEHSEMEQNAARKLYPQADVEASPYSAALRRLDELIARVEVGYQQQPITA